MSRARLNLILKTGQRLLLFAGFYQIALSATIFAKTVCIIYPRAASAVTLSSGTTAQYLKNGLRIGLQIFMAMQAH